MFLGGDAGERLEPVSIVGRTLFDGPVLHHAGDNIRNIQIQRLSLVNGGLEALVGGAGQTLLHNVLVEYHGAVDFLGVCCHIIYSFSKDLRSAEGAYKKTGAVRGSLTAPLL